MKVRSLLLLAGVALALPRPGWSSDEAQLRAAFVYRFAQFTQWPSEPTGGLTLCGAQLGTGEDALRRLGGRALAGLPLRYRSVDTPREAAQRCQVLVLGQGDGASLRRWVQGLAEVPVLVVGTAPESLRAGVDIALLTEPQGLAFSINHSEAKRRGLTLSGQMLKLAREVR